MLEMEEPPASPEDASVIGLVYDFGPDDATFDPPVTLTISYDPAEMPEGFSEENLAIAYWDADAGEWVVLEDCSVDPATHTISAPVSHFTPFTVLAVAEEVVEEEEEVAPPTVLPKPAAFTVSALTISPATVEIGETVTIKVMVTNTGGLKGTYQATLKIDGVEVEIEEVTLAGGASQQVTFTTSKDAAGSYSVSIANLSGTFTVEPAPAPAVNWGLIGGIIGAAVVIILLAIWLVLRRRRA